MVAQPVHRPPPLEFFIPVLALPAHNVFVIGRFQVRLSPGSVRRHEAAIRSLRVRLPLHDYPPWHGPCSGLIPEPREQPLRFARFIPTPDGFGEECLALPL